MIDYMIHTPRCNLFVAMGMGKTSAVLTALTRLDLIEDVFPVLVLAPKRVAMSTWPAEAAEWAHLRHLRVSAMVGNQKVREAALRAPADVYTMNYEGLAWLVEFWGEAWPYKTVVADECTRLKSFRTRQGGSRARALGTVAHRKVSRYIGLTGSPVANGIKDLWSVMWFVDKGERLGKTFSAFSERWFRPDWSGYGLLPLPHSQGEMEALVRDKCFTLKAEDHFDLKAPIVANIYVDLPPAARATYTEMERLMFTELEGMEVEAFGAAAKTTKCLQIASGFLYHEEGWSAVHEEKLDALESIVEEANGTPVLVAYQFKADLERLLARFKSAKHMDANPATVSDWNAGKIPILLAHPASAGHGLSLQHGSNILVYFSHDWNLENRQQIAERIGPVRQLQSGYKRPVFHYNIIARGTVDEDVIARTDAKRTVQSVLMDAMNRRKNP